MHFKSKNQMSEFFYWFYTIRTCWFQICWWNLAITSEFCTNQITSLLSFFISIKIFCLRYPGEKANKKFIIVSEVKNLETDDSAQMFTII